MEIKFKKDFFFGAATAAAQSEGHHNGFRINWDILFEEKPSNFFDQCGPQTVNNTFKDYKQEVAFYKEMGFESFRTSVLWSRIFPKKGVISKEGIEFYHSYFQEITNNGIKLFLTLSHFDLPDWIYDDGGFENYENCNLFLEFGKLVLKEFGKYITFIATFNEPIVPIVHGYMDLNSHPPGVYDKKRAVKAAFGVFLAHSKFVNYFNEEYNNEFNIKVGVVINISPVFPKDNINYSLEDQKVADKYNLVHNYSFLDAMIKGTFEPELVQYLKDNNAYFQPEKEHLQIIAKTKLDMIGVNYYGPARLQVPSQDHLEKNKDHLIARIGMGYKWEDARMNKSRGWEIYPQMMNFICQIIKERYDNIPFYISENGMGVQGEEAYRDESGMIQDDYRIAFIQEHLEELKNGMDKYGANCLGYHLWTGVDCWSWGNAYKNRYGLVEYDLEKKEKRFKKSGLWYKTLNASKSFVKMDKKVEELINCSNKE